jgi:TolA-binding protein
MASPFNASEPESSEEEEEEDIIQHGFDAFLFWDQYRASILVAAAVVVIGLIVYGVYEYNRSQLIAAAEAALATASTDDDYRQVMDKYSGTVAAGDASLFLASKLRTEKKYDDAMQVLQDFLDKYPAHPLAHAGDLSIGEALEEEGKMDDAIAKYQEVAAKYPDSYSAPLATLAQASIYKAEGKIEESRRVYENFVAQFPDSIFAQEAMAEMHMLRPPAGAGAAASPAPTPASGPEGLPSLLNSATPAPMAPAH